MPKALTQEIAEHLRKLEFAKAEIERIEHSSNEELEYLCSNHLTNATRSIIRLVELGIAELFPPWNEWRNDDGKPVWNYPRDTKGYISAKPALHLWHTFLGPHLAEADDARVRHEDSGRHLRVKSKQIDGVERVVDKHGKPLALNAQDCTLQGRPAKESDDWTPERRRAQARVQAHEWIRALHVAIGIVERYLNSKNVGQTAEPVSEGDGDAKPVMTSGFLSGEELANALGIDAARRKAFLRQLDRKRKNLGDDCWNEVADPRPNSPRFLYRVDSPKVRELASRYKAP